MIIYCYGLYSFIFYLSVLFSIVMGDVNALKCDDVNPQACQLLAASKPDLCNDTNIATTTCPRFCGNCGEFHYEKTLMQKATVCSGCINRNFRRLRRF